MVILIIQTIIYGIIEGITEWLPVSSTGHLILFESFWPMNLSADFMSMFRVIIQLGAILAVLMNYFLRLNPFSSKLNKRGRKRVWNNWIRIIVGCIPAGIIGLLFDDYFDEHFYNWQTVAITLFVYGLLFIIVEHICRNRETKYHRMEEIPASVAFIIGCAQALALFPGTSRSGVTIVVALLLGCSRLAAMDYTFCMAIPIMAGSSFLKLLKYIINNGFGFSVTENLVFGIGCVVAFFVSHFTLNILLKYIRRNDFKPFGWYRMALAAVVVALALLFPGILPGSTAEAANKYNLPDYVEESYIDVNDYSRPGVSLLQVNDIVIHYTGNPGTGALANRNYFDGLKNQSGTEDVTYGSSNFIVGLEGEVLAVVPIDEIAYCSNNRNEDTISIETCHPDETGQFNEATYDSLVKLTAWLCNRYGLSSEHVIRHYDVTGKLCPLYYVEHEDAWETFKSDVDKAINDIAAESK